MKPLSERLKDFPNSQFVEWLCLACVDVREVRTPDEAQEEINKIREAVTERLAALEQRAEAAEAKLAELAELGKQEPVYQFICNRPEDDGYAEWADCNADYFSKEPSDMRRILFTRPAPAADLSELVPDEMTFDEAVWSCRGKTGIVAKSFQVGWNACRAAILRNIEEANK